MKVYVIKRNNNTYYKRYFENYVQFEDEIAFAEIYTKKSGAEHTMDFITRNKYRFNILPEELSVVEFSLMETTELSDYTKQVRKEVISKVYEVLEQAVPHSLCWSWAVIKKELDEIEQGETNAKD